jgi:hypothetical protein
MTCRRKAKGLCIRSFEERVESCYLGAGGSKIAQSEITQYWLGGVYLHALNEGGERLLEIAAPINDRDWTGVDAQITFTFLPATCTFLCIGQIVASTSFTCEVINAVPPPTSPRASCMRMCAPSLVARD